MTTSARGWFTLAPALLFACGGEDRAPPSLLAAEFVDPATSEPVALGVAANIAAAQDSASATTPTLGSIRLVFSELLDGDSVTQVVRDPDTQEVTQLIGRADRVRLAPAVASTVTYQPGAFALQVQIPTTFVAAVPNLPAYHLVTYLPAGTTTVVNVMGDLIRDEAGNVMPTATDAATDNPVLDAEGRGIAAGAAFITAGIDVVRVELPQYGIADDPTTTAVNESMPATMIAFNTGLDPASVPAHIRFVPTGGGTPIGVTAAPQGYGAMVAEWQSLTPAEQATWTPRLLDPAVLEVTPDSPPLPGETTYQLRIENGFGDAYGVPYAGGLQLHEFTTSPL